MKTPNVPIQIVMTPVRNEAWVLSAFLKTTSLWADYIIIADQNSTDGSEKIYAQYDKVIVINNNNPDFNEAERQAMLVKKAREIAAGRDTLLWGLDADEILPANWKNTSDGQHILNSKPGDVFWFKWAQLSPDKQHYGDSDYYPWLFHDDGKEPHGNYVRNMHSMRIPYPIEEKQMFYVEDFRVLHCGLLDTQRVAAKNRFYQFVDWEMNKRSPIALSRGYAAHRRENQRNVAPYDLLPESIAFPFNYWSNIKLRKLDIWDEDFLHYYELEDSRRWIDILVHYYLHKTQPIAKLLCVRAMDKILKKLY